LVDGNQPESTDVDIFTETITELTATETSAIHEQIEGTDTEDETRKLKKLRMALDKIREAKVHLSDYFPILTREVCRLDAKISSILVSKRYAQSRIDTYFPRN
jgi:hypothetical protein